jgi:hypothetical protein
MADGTSELGSETSAIGSFEFSFGNDSGSGSGNDTATGDVGSFGVDPAGSLGTDAGDDFTFDPERHIGLDRTNADGSYRRKRKSGGGTRSSPKASRKATSKTSVNVNAVETALKGIHIGLAALTSIPEIALDADESKPLAIAVAEVAKHYDIPDVADKTLAWFSLAMVAGPMYMAKAMLARERMRGNKAHNVTETPIAADGEIVPFFKKPDRSA